MTRSINPNGTLNSYVVSPDEVKPGDRYGYKVIAVVYDTNTWAAYRCFTDWDDQRVADYGDKLDYEIAKRLFPSIDAEIPFYNN